MKKWEKPMISMIGVECTKENLIQSRNGQNWCNCCDFNTGPGDATENYNALMLHYEQFPTHRHGLCSS